MSEKSTNHFVRNIKFVLKQYGPVVSTFLAFLIDQDELRKNTKKKYDGQFYVSRPQIAEETQIKRKAQISCEKILKKAGFITFETEDHNANKYTIQYDVIHNSNPLNDKNVESPSIEEDHPQESTLSDDSAKNKEYSTISEEGATQVGTCTTPKEGAAPPSSIDPVPTPEGVNYNITKSLTKTVSRSAPTYVPDGIDAYYNELGLGRINKKSSCEKNKESETAPSNIEQWSQEDIDSALQITQDYNTAMNIKYNPGTDEISRVLLDLDELQKVRTYFTHRILSTIWNDYGDAKSNQIAHHDRRISGFLAYGFLPKLTKYGPLLAKADADQIDQLLDRVFKQYGNQVSDQISKKGYCLDSWGALEPNDASTHFPAKEHRKVRLEIFHNCIESLLSDDEKKDMMILGV